MVLIYVQLGGENPNTLLYVNDLGIQSDSVQQIAVTAAWQRCVVLNNLTCNTITKRKTQFQMYVNTNSNGFTSPNLSTKI